jgi:hypothetical protein
MDYKGYHIAVTVKQLPNTQAVEATRFTIRLGSATGELVFAGEMEAAFRSREIAEDVGYAQARCWIDAQVEGCR